MLARLVFCKLLVVTNHCCLLFLLWDCQVLYSIALYFFFSSLQLWYLDWLLKVSVKSGVQNQACVVPVLRFYDQNFCKQRLMQGYANKGLFGLVTEPKISQFKTIHGENFSFFLAKQLKKCFGSNKIFCSTQRKVVFFHLTCYFFFK